MSSEISLKARAFFCFMLSCVLILSLSQINEQTISSILAVTLFAFIFDLILRKVLKKYSSGDKVVLVLSFFIALTLTSLLLVCIKKFFPQPETLAFPFIPAIPIAFFTTLFFLFREPVARTLGHLLPWLDSEKSQESNTRMIIPDLTCLEDGRICDLVRTGLLDQQLFLPYFLVEKVRDMMDEEDEVTKERGRQILESIRRLEAVGITCKKHSDKKTNNASSYQDLLFDYAKEHKATILSNDGALQTAIKPEHYDVPVVFLEAIASALKPNIPKGQQLSIKIQRLGKEPKQGIGYLDDRTMVVVNGGGDYLGRQVKIQILSQKYSASGRIIFCNLMDPPHSDGKTFAAVTSSDDYTQND